MDNSPSDKIEFAATTEVSRLREQIDALLEIIAESMGNDGIEYAWVSDESTLADFGLDDFGVEELGKTLGFRVAQDDLLYEIALRMRPLT